MPTCYGKSTLFSATAQEGQNIWDEMNFAALGFLTVINQYVQSVEARLRGCTLRIAAEY
jgi:hypothetical protein